MTFFIWRIETDESNLVARKRDHELRKQIVNDLVKALDLNVMKNKEWDKLNDTTSTYEHVDLIIALNSDDVFTAIVSVFKLWINQKKIKRVECVFPDGTMKLAEDIISEDAKKLGF